LCPWVSVEQLIADSADEHYEALLRSTHDWHADSADPWPCLSYLVTTLAAAYSTFARRAAADRSGGTKQERVRDHVLKHADVVFRLAQVREDISAGDTRNCQDAIEQLSESFIELDESDAPANYIVRLRSEQAGLRKSALRVYHIQREEFLPSAYAMIVSFVVMILLLLMFTRIGGQTETLVTLGFLSFFFLYLLRLLNVINKPFKVGQERGDDDVSLFLLYEFVVHARLADRDLTTAEVVEIAEQIEEAEADDEAKVPTPAGPDDAPADLDDVIDAVTSEPAEPRRDPNATPDHEIGLQND
jgi:hypothetical protein